MISTPQKVQPPKFLFRALSIIAFGALWEALARSLQSEPRLFPTPWDVFNSLFDVDRFEFFRLGYTRRGAEIAVLNAVLGSLGRVTLGTALGSAAGILVGLLLATSRVSFALLTPVLTLLAPVSPIAWIPFAMVLLGVGNLPALFVVFVAVFFAVALGTLASLQNVDPDLLVAGRTLGATRWQMLWTVELPAAGPAIVTLVRLNMFAGWMAVLAAEMVGITDGLGQMVMVGRALFDVKMIVFAATLIGVCGYLLDTAFRYLARKYVWWSPKTNAEDGAFGAFRG